MKILRHSGFALLFAVLLFLVACGGAAGPQAPDVDWSLTVEGAVDTPLTLSYSDLAGMEQVSLGEILMQKSTGEDNVGDWEGVPVETLLEQAGASPEASGITAIASDGYAIMISMADLEDAIVALKSDGEWIATADEQHGPIRLVVPNKPANHWVFQLTTIVVEGAGALPPQAEWELTFEGAVDNERTFEFVQLTGFERVELEGLVVQSKSGESTHDFEGVPLTTLFDLVALRSDAKSITAEAADGYSVPINIADLGDEAMVALIMDGEWLVETDPESPIRLVVPGLPANKWVSQLVKITASTEAVAEEEPAETPQPTETPEPPVVEVPDVEWELTVDGAVDTESTWTYADLAAMDTVVVEDVLKQTQRDDSTHTYAGVLLSDLFALAGVDSAATTLAATASDGYSSSVPLADLGSEALVALKEDGEWLAVADPESPLELVIPEVSASNWVSMLVTLTLE